MSYRENISYLVPRDPSIKCWSDRVKLPRPCSKNLIEMSMDEFEETMGDKIKVYLRLKPSSSLHTPYSVLSPTTLQTEAPKESVSYKNVTNGKGKLIHKFTFTSILDQATSQGKLFSKCALKNLKKFLFGENYLLMAYGTTSAGKTYTMQGNVEHPGVIPRALDFVFIALKDNIIPVCRYSPYQYNEFMELTEDQMRRDLKQKNFILSLDLTKCQRYPDGAYDTFQTNSSGFSDAYENRTFKDMRSNLVETESFEVGSDSFQYSIWISMIEIYNEQVYDLLEIPNEKGARPKLTFRDDEFGNTFVKNLRYVNVSSGHEAFQILQFGRSNLHLAPTALNCRSSRSHCIFTITLAKFLDYETSSHAIISRFSFCDLAGMERAKKTLNEKDRLVESKAINTSLSILVKCLTTIKENQNSKEKKIIPYRESKLTKLFRDAVTGKEQFALVVNVTTDPNLFDETLNVLKFSAIAQEIVPQNVFARPKVARAVNKTRFSRILMNSSYNSKTIIDWETSTATESEPEVKVKENSCTSEMEELQDLVESLRRQLATERIRCEEIEGQIRQELTRNFSEILKKQNESYQVRLEGERESLQEMYEKKQRRLVYYYEMLHRNKRPKPDDDVSDYEDEEEALKELEKSVESLKTENTALKTQLQELLCEKNRIVLECSELKFKLVEKDREFEMMQRAHKAGEDGEDGLVKELRKQLDAANAKISDFKSLLDEAATDYKESEENNKFLRNENEILEQHLTEHRELLADMRNENTELQKILSQKRIIIEKLEDANEKILEELKTERDEEQKKVEEMKNSICLKEVEILREQLRKTSEWLGNCREECDALRGEKLDLEIEKLEMEDLRNRAIAFEEKEAEMERRLVKELESKRESEAKAEELAKENKSLEEKCKEFETEVKALQKEVKDLISSSKKENDRLLELEAFSKENETYQKESLSMKNKISELEEELKVQAENVKICQRESKIALETLRAKFDAVEYQNTVMKKLKDEAERQAYEVPLLHEEIKRLEKEIENREKDMASFNENRKTIFNNYEKEITRLKEENERLRKDVLFANEVIAKTMTPLKTDKAEISRLKESVKKKDEEINRLKAEVGSFKRQEPDPGKKFELCEKDVKLEESSSKENSPFVSLKKKNKSTEAVKGGGGEATPDKLMKQIENLSIQPTEPKTTRKKIDLMDETIHPSTIKKTNKGRKKKEYGKKEKELEKPTEEEKENVSVKKGKCYKKLFTDNDFDGLIDLNASPLKEISRLRPRK